jgi:hypothetical protein
MTGGSFMMHLPVLSVVTEITDESGVVQGRTARRADAAALSTGQCSTGGRVAAGDFELRSGAIS